MAASAYYLSREQLVFSRLLAVLQQVWPSAANVSLRVLDIEDVEPNRSALLRVVELLSDEGIASHEALINRHSQGPEVVGAYLTARGRAALRSAEAEEKPLEIASYFAFDAADANSFSVEISAADISRSSR